MSKVGPTILVVILLIGSGCKSAEARCAESRVVANDAWTAYSALVDADVVAAQLAFNQADAAARPSRDSACREAWRSYVTTLTRSEGSASEAGPSGVVGFVVADMSARAADGSNPCNRSEGGWTTGAPNPGSIAYPLEALTDNMGEATFAMWRQEMEDGRTVAEKEAAAVASGVIPSALVQQRDTAILAATQAYDATVGPARLRRDWTAQQSANVRAALGRAIGPAIAARDAARLVTDDPTHPQSATARAAAEVSWLACQSVAP
jgi:hypothetical protein